MPTLNNEFRIFITETIMFGQGTELLGDDTSFLDTGLIDSTGVLELVGYIEHRFGFHVADNELTPENLDSINGLSRYVEKKSLCQTR
jgi:acyl carrier protein